MLLQSNYDVYLRFPNLLRVDEIVNIIFAGRIFAIFRRVVNKIFNENFL